MPSQSASVGVETRKIAIKLLNLRFLAEKANCNNGYPLLKVTSVVQSSVAYLHKFP